MGIGGGELRSLVITAYDNPLKKNYYNLTPFKKWIVTSASKDLIAKKIKYFSKKEIKTKKMVDEGYNWVKSQTWENLVKKYEKLWEVRVT